MRIAYITADPGVPVFGRKGCSIHVQEVLRALGGHGAQIELFATSCAGAPLPGLESVRVHALPPAPKGELACREQACLRANDVLRAALEREGPFAFVYERYSLWSFAGMEYAQAMEIPGLLEVNAPLIEEQAEHRGLVDRASAERVAGRVFAAASALLAVSDEVGEYLERFSRAAGKVRVLPNGVDPGRFPESLAPSSPAPAGMFTVGFVGTLKPWHGLEILLEAFERLHRSDPDTRLLIVGDGVGREKLAGEVTSRGLCRAVQFTGAVMPGEVPGLLASMDVAVAPYPRLPNFYFSPLKVYEYMAAGLLVVASQTGQIEKLIVPEVNGLLVPPGDVMALVEALKRVRSEPELRQQLGRRARSDVIRNHTWEAVARSILRLAAAGLPRHLEQRAQP